jgi:hypothetical protein
MAGMHDDLFDRLDHDHAPVSAVMLEIQEWFRSGEGDLASLRDKLELLKDLVIEHFGEEEENVFPILSELLPAAAESLAELASGHDAMCGLAVRLGAVASRGEPDMATMTALFERLETSYGEHARREQAALRAIRGRLSADKLDELGKRLRALG